MSTRRKPSPNQRDIAVLEQDALVVMSKDSEGNSFSPLYESQATTYKATREWNGEIDDDSKPSKKNGTVAAVVLWPTN